MMRKDINMKWLSNISNFLNKLLFVFLAVSFLAACGKDAKDDDLVTLEPVEIGDKVAKLSVNPERCIGCEILDMMYDAVGKNVGILHKEFTKASMPIIMVGFSIWLALRLLKFVSSVTETNPREVWNEILRKAFICMICGILAGSPTMLRYTVNTIVFPVYSALMDLGLQVLQNSFSDKTNSSIQSSLNTDSFIVFKQPVDIKKVELKCSLNKDSKGNTILWTEDSGFPQSIKGSMKCMIDALNKYLTIGENISVIAMKQKARFIGKIMGLVLYCFFWVVKIGFVFYLVDTIFKMGIIILLLPLFILSYAFGPTKKWTGIGFGNILASAGFMMCFSIIVSLTLVAMVSLINGNPGIFNPDDPEAHMRDISIGFMCLLIIGFLIYGSMGVAQQLTSGLLGTGISSNFQQKLKAAIQGIGSAIWSGLGFLVTTGVAALPDGGNRFVKAIKRGHALHEKLQRLAGRR